MNIENIITIQRNPHKVNHISIDDEYRLDMLSYSFKNEFLLILNNNIK